MSLTSDRDDPRLSHGADKEPGPQNEVYLVLGDEERAKGFVRPVRRSYRHQDPECGAVTTMGHALAETYAREPGLLRRDVLLRLPDAPAGRRTR